MKPADPIVTMPFTYSEAEIVREALLRYAVDSETPPSIQDEAILLRIKVQQAQRTCLRRWTRPLSIWWRRVTGRAPGAQDFKDNHGWRTAQSPYLREIAEQARLEAAGYCLQPGEIVTFNPKFEEIQFVEPVAFPDQSRRDFTPWEEIGGGG